MKAIRWLVLFLLSSIVFAQTNPTVTTACPCSIFTAGPVNTKTGPDTSVELGTRFTSDVNSNVVALRFYKMPTASGVHTATLWGPNKEVLATVTFTNEGSFGWQSQALTNPVPVSAGVTYTVSYHTNNGFYARDANVFVTPLNNPPLHGLSGAYAYGTSQFPKNNTTASYYADVVLAKYARLSWTASDTANALYNVYRSEASGAEDLTSPLAFNIKGTSYLDFTVLSGVTYYYVVTATIQSPPSNELQLTIP